MQVGLRYNKGNILGRGSKGPHEEAVVISAESQSTKTTKEYGGLRSVQGGGTGIR